MYIRTLLCSAFSVLYGRLDALPAVDMLYAVDASLLLVQKRYGYSLQTAKRVCVRRTSSKQRTPAISRSLSGTGEMLPRWVPTLKVPSCSYPDAFSVLGRPNAWQRTTGLERPDNLESNHTTFTREAGFHFWSTSQRRPSIAAGRSRLEYVAYVTNSARVRRNEGKCPEGDSRVGQAL
ncbi:uncharacterized protein B0H18DRAFT_316820 [Fomitopsis serialis]|uniref:uncharacterized protein n=1 Tax=Fomitopsis serialis TaxID=139415 RepID=UPI002007B276|nr:uncharacterized protein B0H18DRAFT_316820 [Neoantrodia serialis]KAH9936224.1 hypothetical protein B0H18DRAFT_316820 [Neoantrodia serialis]